MDQLQVNTNLLVYNSLGKGGSYKDGKRGRVQHFISNVTHLVVLF